MSNGVYGKTMGNLGNTRNQQKTYLKWTSKPSYTSQKYLTSKITLKLNNKPAKAGM